MSWGYRSSVTDLFGDIGRNLQSFVTNAEVLYGLYFIAMFFAMFSIFNVLLQKVEQFHGKPAKVIAFMVTVIGVGSIFYKYGSAWELINAFHGFVNLILVLILSLAVLGGAYFFAFPKDESKQRKQLTQTVIMSWAVYVATAILAPSFGKAFTVITISSSASGVFISVVSSANATGIFIYKFLTFVSSVAFLVALISTIIFGFSLFSFANGSANKENDFLSEDEKRKRKDVEDVKGALSSLNEIFNDANGDFNKKVQEANNMLRLREV